MMSGQLKKDNEAWSNSEPRSMPVYSIQIQDVKLITPEKFHLAAVLEIASGLC